MYSPDKKSGGVGNYAIGYLEKQYVDGLFPSI